MITYVTGDATEPVKKPALIMHVCNDIGGWGRGFVMALSKRWRHPESSYRAMPIHVLGAVDYMAVEWNDDDGKPSIIVANMIAQHGTRPFEGTPPIRYEALASCLRIVASIAGEASIHCPRIGCGLAGGSWSVVEPLIEFYLKDREVYVYDLPT